VICWVSREIERGVGGLLVRCRWSDAGADLGGLLIWCRWSDAGAGLIGELGGLLGFEGNSKGEEFLGGNGFGS
jgi:hypothetical protein